MLGLGVEQYSLLILLIEYQAENKKGEMYSKNSFEAAGNLLQMNCQLSGIQIPMSCKIRFVCYPSDCQSIPNT